MRRLRLLAAPLLLTVALLAAGPVAEANASAHAGKPMALTLIGSKAILGIVDTGQPGPTPGDVRTLSLTMSDTKGVEVGHAEIVQTLTRQQDGVGTAVKVVVMDLPKGTLTIVGDVNFLNFTDSAARPLDTTEHLAVVGGTGAYRGAGGQVDIVVLPGFTSRRTISLDRH